MPRRAHRLDANQDVIVNVLCAEPDVSVFSLAGVAAGCPDLLVGIKGVTHLVEVKDGAKPPSRRTFTPDQRRWIERWQGGPVVVLTDEATARAWVRREEQMTGTTHAEFTRRQQSARERAAIIRRARAALADIEQYFVDVASWNDNATARQEGCDPIDPDPDGRMGRMRDGLTRMLAAEGQRTG